MKNVFFTGSSGFIGRNVCPYLSNKHHLFIPRRDQLNLLDEKEVFDYIKSNHIEIVINAANPNAIRTDRDLKDKEFEDRLRIFLNIRNARELFDFCYNIGSGAEYNKAYDIKMVSEFEYGKTIPYDSYGMAKYAMHEISKNDENIIDLITFAIFGPTDHYSKFITHCIDSCKKNVDITIRQDCYFDYLYVMDFAKILDFFINHIPKYKEYNITTGNRYLLSDIAKIVMDVMNVSNNIVFLHDGLNNEYTADNARLCEELGEFSFTSLRDGIIGQINGEIKNEEKSC